MRSGDLEREGERWTRQAFVLLQRGKSLVRDWPEDVPSNCLIAALGRMYTRGGSLELLPSEYGPWVHARWIAPDGLRREFNPVEKHRQDVPPPLFYGSWQIVPGAIRGGEMFGPSELHAAVTKALVDASVPADAKRAFVLVATSDGIVGAFTVRANEVWEVRGTIAADHEDGLTGGVSVKAVW